jgi:molecular chaperone GrpE
MTDNDNPALQPETQETTAAGATAQPGREQLEIELAEARSQLETAFADVLRARAELDNARKRAQREVEQAHRYGLERWVNELLPVCDSMEMGVAAARSTDDIASMRQGLELTLKMFLDALARSGVLEVHPAAGERFNPERHQAMGMEASPEHASGSVVRVLQKGFVLSDRLLRPALVIVAQ